MSLSLLFVCGLLVAVFVGFNIGGSSTGVAFGPAVGSNVIGKVAAAGLMTGFALLGGWTVGRNVIETMSEGIVPNSEFTLLASVGVLFFVGFALLISNLFGVPASTSMTAVGSIAGLGVATGTIDWSVMGRIVSWWLFAPMIAFWVCAVIGRYFYPHLDAHFELDRSAGSLLRFEHSGVLPTPVLNDTTRGELLGALSVVGIGCYMAFSAGASNVANAIAPLVGSGDLALEPGILLAAGAIGFGAFTIARRTLNTVGNDLTDLPILAALIVEIVSASLITFLSSIGIPASLAVSATMCIIGLGWGRATRTTTFTETATAAIRGSKTETSKGMVRERSESIEESAPKAAERSLTEPPADDLYNPAVTARVFILWVLTPSIAVLASYVTFKLVFAL
ncbi:inorganic phosphate transporter [Halegenticoccus tardaugens]|uniref:inorganic phosphate transporter n=1 Tax=Halegenticoccus tardaugens TaxID=2071624 RepID=UPI00100A7E8C|nr:inorganic phosphate transporter [Halegenticoccus tardaugens]